ncbi:hypothetical protein [Paenibacillus xylanilyticus]|uniref:hypothetical protein n=1 Tax=Paenibacillus xylanilyticus TaxID=248903 RepID=UPI0039A3E88E
MRKNNYFTSVLILLMGCSVLLAACDVITAQTITNTGSAQGMNGGGMMNGGADMNGGTPRGGGTGMNGRTGGPSERGGMMNADLTGRIISIDGNTVTVELLEFKDNSSQNSDNLGQQGGAPGGSMEMNETGVEMKLTLDADVSITEGMAMGGRGNTSQNTNSTTIQVSDLKEGDVVMVWYKENTETVERMAVIQS